MIAKAVLLILCLPALIVIHELGHYWCARWLGIQLSEFSIGLGPKLRSWQRRGVLFSLHIWPIAAHVRPAVTKGDDRRFIQNHPAWHQLIFLAGGAIANFSTAFLVLALRCWANGAGFWDGLGEAIAQLWQMMGMLGGHVLSLLFGIRQIGGLGDRVMDLAEQIAFLSVCFGLVNLVPVHPFDGGRILVIVLRTFGNRKR